MDSGDSTQENETEGNKTMLKQVKQLPSPRVKASIFSILSFWWMNSFMKLGRSKTLEVEDFYHVLPCDESEALGMNLNKAWKKQVESKASGQKPSLAKAMMGAFGPKFVLINLIILLDECGLKILLPICMGQLILCFDSAAQVPPQQPYLYATGLVACSILSSLCEHTYGFKLEHMGMQLNTSASSLIYQKSLRLSIKALGQTSIGKVVNLLSNDVSSFTGLVFYLQFLWIAPFQLALITIVLYFIIGPSCVVGLVVTLLYIPLQGVIGRFFSTLRKKATLRTDDRINTMTEIIAGIRGIKMFAWEKPFSNVLQLSRKLEIKVIRFLALLHSFNGAIYFVSSKFTVFFIFLTYILTGNVLTSYVVFVTISLFDKVRLMMTNHFFMGVVTVAEATVSIKRVEEFLLLDEKADDGVTEELHLNTQCRIECSQVSVKWPSELGEVADLALAEVSFTVQTGEVLAVVGPVGAGKSTLLHLLLGELPCFNSDGICRVTGRVAYASQEPWIFSGTIRENILCGLEYDEARFNQVIQVTSLERDFSLFPHGAGTLVGERGISLSGGQKARVNLARCLYVDADIYLLDDPLSAVDTHVGRRLVDEAVNGFLRSKIRILVTHQLQFLKDFDRILVIKKGRVEAVGTYQEVMEQTNGFLIDCVNHEENPMTPISSPDEMTAFQRGSSSVRRRRNDSIKSNKSAVEETLAAESCVEGAVKWSIYKEYFKGGSGHFWSFSLFLVNLLISQVLLSGTDYWLNIWTNAERIRTEPAHNSSNSSSLSWQTQVDTETGIYVFAGLLGALFVCSLVTIIHFFLLCLNSSVSFHDRMLHSVIRAPMAFFDRNPVGRILNRFSFGVGCMDQFIPLNFIRVFFVFVQSLGVIVIVAVINPWLLIPVTLLVVIAQPLRITYAKTSRSVRRIAAVVRSPIYSHLSNSLNGLTTLRAHRYQTAFQRMFHHHLDISGSTFYTVLSASRWYGIRVDVLLLCYLICVIYTCVGVRNDMNSSEAGLMLSSALSLAIIFHWAVLQSVEVANTMTVVERAMEYCQLPSEAPLESNEYKKPPANWPSQGAIQFDRISLCYDRSDRPVLKDVTCSVRSGEKIGIVGRTGAGKSSLIAALFRLAEPEGRILVDGVDIKDIGLHDLRPKISVIPQDPLLFSGTMRRNLDPFGQYEDVTLWSALEVVRLKETIIDDSVISSTLLDYALTEGGSNLSVGQRQLICLARAILRQNRILVLDEATANVDQKTDALIQTTIRDKFKDCTVLTIAHRLNTIMDSDRVMVLDGGELKEFDEPLVLLKDPKSLFRCLVEQTGPELAAELKFSSEKAAYERRADKEMNETPCHQSFREQEYSTYL